MKIQIETIPHNTQRYPTIGDWFYDDQGVLHIKASQMSDERYSLLVAIHELIECVLCKQHGITQQQVDDFDMQYDGNGEAGDCSTSPYKNEHTIAVVVERLMAERLGVDWSTYENEVTSL